MLKLKVAKSAFILSIRTSILHFNSKGASNMSEAISEDFLGLWVPRGVKPSLLAIAKRKGLEYKGRPSMAAVVREFIEEGLAKEEVGVRNERH